MRQSLLRILVAFIAGCLVSCIDSREEYWLAADGSGRAEITCDLPAVVAAAHGGESGLHEMIDSFLKQTPEFHESTCDVLGNGERVQVKIAFAFDSAMLLKNSGCGDTMRDIPAAALHLMGDVTVDLHGRRLEFTRKISASKALPGAMFMPASQFDGHRMTYIVHLPSKTEESNATRVENAGRTLVWDIPLSQALNAPTLIHFKMAAPIPWQYISLIVIPFSMAGWLAIRTRKSWKRFSGGYA